MPVAAEIVQALQVLVTRRINTFDPVVVTITKIRAGTTNNVIPETVHMVGTLRAVSETAAAARSTRCTASSKASRARTTCTPSCTSHRGYPGDVNDDDSAAFALRVAGELLGADAAGRMPAPVMGAEDFSYVLQQRPGRDVVPRRVPARRAPGARRTRATRTA